MSENVKNIAYSPLFWSFTFLGLGIICIISVLYIVKIIHVREDVGITKNQIRTAVKTSLLSAIGPSIVVMVGLISMIALVGTPTALLRISVAGNLTYEMLSVAVAADAFGTTVGDSEITENIYQLALFLMPFGIIGSLLIPAFLCKKMDKIQTRIGSHNLGLIISLSSSAIVGCYAYISAPYIVSMDVSTLALITGFLVMFTIQKIHSKVQKNWLLEWGPLFSMFAGAFITILV